MIEIRRHNAGFCEPCFRRHCLEQVRRAIDRFGMLEAEDRVLVGVSGGKDSLMVWDVLTELGYATDGVYIGLGIGDYSDESRRRARTFADQRGLALSEVDLESEYGYTIPERSARAHRSPCGVCGLSKRHVLDQAAREGGYDALATGHNLDDEAAVLFGNVLRWDEGFLGRQFPVLSASSGFVKKVKPLVRLGERETAAYCLLAGIDYVTEECPMSAGNRHLGYKELLNELENRSPGAKTAFLFGFLDRAHERFADRAREERASLAGCARCGAPTPTGVCAFCRLRERATTDDARQGTGSHA